MNCYNRSKHLYYVESIFDKGTVCSSCMIRTLIDNYTKHRTICKVIIIVKTIICIKTNFVDI